jgi:ferric-dicitrate binding protein FerR (iron transport regulator)
MKPPYPDSGYQHALRMASLIYKTQRKQRMTTYEKEELKAWRQESSLHEELFRQLMDPYRLTAEAHAIRSLEIKQELRSIFLILGLTYRDRVRKFLGKMIHW